MDIYSFINSKDIREYLSSKWYNFDPIEEAWIVYFSKKRLFEDKRRCFNLICLNLDRFDQKGQKHNISGHDLCNKINEYIYYVINLEREFRENNPEYVYHFEYHINNTFGWLDDGIVYPELRICLGKIVTNIYGINLDTTVFRVTRQSLLNPNDRIVMDFDSKGRLIDVVEDGNCQIIEDTRKVFNEMRISFPTPFKTGDIVWLPYCMDAYDRTGIYGYKPLVLEHLDDNEYRVYHMNEVGELEKTDYVPYMDLEYYNQELSICHKLLLYLSWYLKREVDLPTLLNCEKDNCSEIISSYRCNCV